MKVKYWLVLMFFLVIHLHLRSQNLIIYGSLVQGIPLWNNVGGDFLERKYSGLMVRGYKISEKKYRLGFHGYFQTYTVASEKVMGSLNDPMELIDRTAAFNTCFNLGPLVRLQKDMGHGLMFVYGLSGGLNLTYKNAFEVTYYPEDPAATGFSSERIRAYHNGFFSTYGYFIMPWADLNYDLRWEFFPDTGLHLGVNVMFKDAMTNSTYESLPNTHTEVSTVKYQQKLSSLGAGIHFGLTGKL